MTDSVDMTMRRHAAARAARHELWALGSAAPGVETGQFGVVTFDTGIVHGPAWSKADVREHNSRQGSLGACIVPRGWDAVPDTRDVRPEPDGYPFQDTIHDA